MTDACHCSVNPNPHEHRYLRPLEVAALVGRPFKTVYTWYRRGDIPAIGEGQYGQLRGVRLLRREPRHDHLGPLGEADQAGDSLAAQARCGVTPVSNDMRHAVQ